MKSDKRFSRYIMGSLVIFMGMSFILIAAGAYFYSDYKMDKSGNAILDMSQRGFSETLTRQLDYISESLDHVASDILIRDYLIHNDIFLLSDMIKARYAFEAKGMMTIYDNLNKRFIPELTSDVIALRPLLEELSTKENQVSVFKKTDNNVFMTIFSIPVMDMDRRIGTGYLLYNISKDRHFWETVHSTRMTLNRVLIIDEGGGLYNLETGEEIDLTDEGREILLSNPAGIIENIFTDDVLLPLSDYPNMFYAANNDALNKQKQSFNNILFYLCVFVLILTLLVSFFIAKIISRPIENMANEAIEIAREPSNVFLNEGKAEYFEFKKLCRAFNQVLSSLFKAQEELKSKARKELEASEERYRLTVEAAPDGIILTRINDGIILQANDTFMRLTGYTREEVIGRTTLELALYSDPVERERVYDALREKGEINNMDIRYKLKNGRILDCRLSARRVKFHGEDCAIAVVSDYSEQKKAEEEKNRLEGALQRASKMEAIGSMAGGVAHDLNNILSGIVGYPELLLMDIPEDSRLRKPLITIQKSGEKAAAIVQDMLTLARRGVSVTEVVNLNNIILEQLKSPEHKKMMSYYSGININTDLEPNLLNIIGSDLHLSKTIMNLISNAVEAMPSGGNINISTENKYIDTNIRGYDNVREGDYVVLTVSDDGNGISPEDQEKIFEPFYTKKKMGRSGTGLGMAVVWGTVKDHDGYIDIQSVSDHGATFKLYFPVTRKDLIKEESEALIEKYMGNGESVLVVDDVPEQREIASCMLMKLGYSVSSVSSGEEAIEYIKQNPTDIMVLDMIMLPGIDGLETYKRIIEIHPGQKAIVASGFSETNRVRETQRLGAGAYVKKPYLLKNIGPAIRRELEK